VTARVRRVGRFDPEIVRRAIKVNRPTRIVLNHLDYVDPRVRDGCLTANARGFIERMEADIGRFVDWVGTGPDQMMDRQPASALA
jgi:adenylosuccinate synthase